MSTGALTPIMAPLGGRSARSVLRATDGVDQLSLAHAAGTAEAQRAGELLQFRQDHRVEAGPLSLRAPD